MRSDLRHNAGIDQDDFCLGEVYRAILPVGILPGLEPPAGADGSEELALFPVRVRALGDCDPVSAFARGSASRRCLGNQEGESLRVRLTDGVLE